MTLSERGLLETSATNTSGLVVGELSNDNELEMILASWVSMTSSEIQLRTWVEGCLESEREQAEELVEGEIVETTKAGHLMIYQDYNAINTEGEAYVGIFGTWYCEISGRTYMLNFMSTEENIFPIYQRYLDSFVCH